MESVSISNANERTPVLQVLDYSLSYATKFGQLQALKNINLTVEHGQTHGLVGESGSGKSSLALAILRYLPGSATENNGRLLLSGESLRDCTLPQILEIRGRRVSMVFQDPSTSLNPTMRLGDQLSEVFVRHQGLTQQEALEESEAALARTGIAKPKEMLRRFPHEASGGEKQRVVIATAFACNPELIIFDEPTTALDLGHQQQTLDLICRIRSQRKLTVVMTMHDLSLAGQYSDRIILLSQGQIASEGTPEDVLNPDRLSALYGARIKVLEVDSDIVVIPTRSREL